MKAGVVALVVLAASATLTAIAPAGPGAARQRVVITAQAQQPTNAAPFTLTPLQPGAVKDDSGKLVSGASTTRTEMREGQSVEIFDAASTFAGKLGSLAVHFRIEYAYGGNGYHAGAGTWKVVRGTGQYARITGGGRIGTVWLDRGPWSSRSEGFLTLR